MCNALGVQLIQPHRQYPTKLLLNIFFSVSTLLINIQLFVFRHTKKQIVHIVSSNGIKAHSIFLKKFVVSILRCVFQSFSKQSIYMYIVRFLFSFFLFRFRAIFVLFHSNRYRALTRFQRSKAIEHSLIHRVC